MVSLHVHMVSIVINTFDVYSHGFYQCISSGFLPMYIFLIPTNLCSCDFHHSVFSQGFQLQFFMSRENNGEPHFMGVSHLITPQAGVSQCTQCVPVIGDTLQRIGDVEGRLQMIMQQTCIHVTNQTSTLHFTS